MGTVTVALLNDVCDLARQSESLVEFRRATVTRLRRTFGFDAVVWGPVPVGPVGTPRELSVEGLAYGEVERRMQLPDVHEDLRWANAALRASGITVDGGFDAMGKRRSAFFAELARLDVRSYASVVVGDCQGVSSAIRLTRSRQPFREHEARELGRMSAVLTACEALFDATRLLPRSGDGALTPRQAAIVDLVCRGFTNPEIARALHISQNTVRNHLARVFRQLDVTTRAELVATVLRNDVNA